jgi:hypothetical protein
MPRRRKTKTQAEHTSLAITIDGYNARVQAGTNLHLYGSSRYVIDDEEPVFCFDTVLELSGICSYPDDRDGDRYEITLRSSMTVPPDLQFKIKDLQQRDKDGVPRYRKYRDGYYPVYGEPPALAFLEKVRGQHRWTVWVWVAKQTVTDSLLLISSGKPVYVSLQEIKQNRRRKIRSLSVQTTDPAEE